LCAYLCFNSIEPSKTRIKNKIDELGSKIKELDARFIDLENEKNKLRHKIRHEPHNRLKLIEEIKRIDSATGYRRHLDTDLATLKNISNAMSIKPSIADHAINIGLDKTNEQWIRYLYEVGDLTSNLYLDSVLGRREEVFGFDKNIGESV
jgi:chromosome segregation ATPase